MEVFCPYPGVALVVCRNQSVLIGAPTDAFKAVKALCHAQQLPFPRTLVAPPVLLSDATPQFVPEFFLYDYLFVYGAAFDAKRRASKLQFVMHPPQIDAARQALRMTLTGPTESELQQMARQRPSCGLDGRTIGFLTAQSAHMAIKVEGIAQPLENLIDCTGFDAQCCARLLDGELAICQADNNSITLRHGDVMQQVDLRRPPVVLPWARLPPPALPARPQTFAVQTLGSRSGFDLSGPTSGFLLWVNGRALLVDGPPGTTTLLAQQGIALSDLDGIILSHCHEDHMGAFVELVLSGQPLKVYTSEPIYRSALLKLAGYLDITPAAAALYIDYVCIVPEVPLELLGAQFTFFYTVHAIPTLGVRVEMRHRGRRFVAQISGDHMHHAGLLQMRQRGQLSFARYHRMRQLVPATYEADSLYFVDAGEALIHGHPGDYTRNPNDIIFYHCPDTDYTRSFGRPVAAAGELRVLVEEPRACAVPPARLWQALRILQLDDPAWLAQILHSGRWCSLRTGETLAGAESLCLVVSGTLAEAPPQKETWVEQAWGPGEMFGHLGPQLTLHPAAKVALTPCELFLIDTAVVAHYLAATAQGERLRRLCALREGSLDVPALSVLPALRRHEVCRRAEVRHLAANEEVAVGDAIWILLSGTASVAAGTLSPGVAGVVLPADRQVRAREDSWWALIEAPMVRRLTALCPAFFATRQELSRADDA